MKKHISSIQFSFANRILKNLTDTQKKWDLKRKYPKFLFQPFMSDSEFQLFNSLCKDKKTFLEYGSGGSTIYFLKNGKRVYSVESSLSFHTYMNSISIVKKFNGDLLHSTFLDLGVHDKWGKPETFDKQDQWYKYYSEVWKKVISDDIKVDAIFIDGRFRVCCCLYSIIKVIENGWTDTLFIIHDFWNRKEYHEVLNFLDEHQSDSTLGSFKIKENIDLNSINLLLEQYANEAA